MSKYTISWARVKKYVQQQPDGALIGRRRSACHCVIAEATNEKYPGKVTCIVPSHTYGLSASVYTEDETRHNLYTGKDTDRLNELGWRYDKATGSPNKQDVLELMKEIENVLN